MAFDWSATTNSVPDTAEEIGCSAWELDALIRRDESPVPIIRLGRKIVVPTAGVRRILLMDDRQSAFDSVAASPRN